MTYNDLLAGFPGAKYNLLKEYVANENLDHVYVEFRCGDDYTCFIWGKSFSYCLFDAKWKPDYIKAQNEMMKTNNPEFYAFAESIKYLFGH